MVGCYFLKPFLETTWDDFLEKFNDEIKAAYEVTRAVLPYMVKQNYGRIVYVATGSAKYPILLVQLLLERQKQHW
jgi:3-oxoacyl-[acyl-carrier protein] reductase